jgi:outer membrane cobalamin receptor
MFRVLVGFAFALTCAAASALAQQPVAVSGTVKDASGGVLPGATVTVVVADQVVATATTGENGLYQVQVAPGVRFQVRTHLDGFADEAIDVSGSNAPVTRDIVLQIGRVSDRLSVTASRAPESLARVTESVTIATAEDIHALGASGLADVVRFVPGVAVEGNGRDGGLTAMFSRGGESDYNLVLIDGVRVNQNGGSFDFGRITANNIDRIEVVRGAQSSLWGSDAMGSVVQVFTKRGVATDAPRVSGSLEGGTFKTFRGDVTLLGGAIDRIDYSVGASRRQNDGAFADLLPEDDTFEQNSFDASAGATLGARATVRGGVRYSRAQGHSPGNISFGSRAIGTAYDTKDLSWHVDLSHSAGPRYTGTATVNGFRYEGLSADRTIDPPFTTFAIVEGTPGALFPNGIRLVRLITEDAFNQLAAAGASPGPNQYIASRTTSQFAFSLFESKTELRRPGFRYHGDLMWANGQKLSAGWDWEREIRPEQTTPSTLPELSLTNNAFFVQQQLNFLDRWFVTVGVRADSKETFDTFVSPKLSAGGFVLPAQSGAVSSVKVFGNIGKGIKSPSFSERYGGSFADPNPDLKVERARTADLGVEATFADQRVRAGATYFHNDYKDQIAFLSFTGGGDGIPDIVNIDGSRAKGVEVELAVQRPVAGLTAGVTYALVDTKVVTNVSTSQQFQPGQPLLRRPKHSGTVRVGYGKGRLSANFDTRWVGDRHDNSFFALRTVANASRPSFTSDLTVNPGYAVAGFAVDYRVDRRASVFVRVNNVGDTEYDSALGYPGLPRNAMVGVRFNVSR